MATTLAPPKQCIDRSLTLISRSTSKVRRVIREQYLRDDIPCRSPLCQRDCESAISASKASSTTTTPTTTATMLPADISSHLMFPDYSIVHDYIDVLSTDRLNGIVFTQTVETLLQTKSKHACTRLRRITNDIRRHSILFPNVNNAMTFSPRSIDEDSDAYHFRLVYLAAVWFYEHLDKRVPVVVLTTHSDLQQQFANSTIGVVVMLLDDYLWSFWPDDSELRDIYESCKGALLLSQELAMSMDALPNNGNVHPDTGFCEYKSVAELEAGVRSGIYMCGVLHVSKRFPRDHSVVKCSTVDNGDIAVDRRDVLIVGQACRNRAMARDKVYVELLPRSMWHKLDESLGDCGGPEDIDSDDDASFLEGKGELHPTGRVVGICRRAWRPMVATLRLDGDSGDGTHSTTLVKSDRVLMVPLDSSLPLVRIVFHDVERISDTRTVIMIDSWPVSSRFPNGHYVRSLGPIGDIDTEIQSILVEHDILVPDFSDNQLCELPTNSPSAPWLPDDCEVSKRRDLRDKRLIYSIDPLGSQDVDDALSVHRLAGGHIELSVHIADVSYFVQPGSFTDSEARTRSTTVYLSDRRYDMLPKVLSEDLCSLLGGHDRYAFSVIWTLDADFNIISSWFGRTVIRSSYQLHYEQAQDIFDKVSSEADIIASIPQLGDLNGVEARHRVSELRDSISLLIAIARKIRRGRLSAGALELESAEVHFKLSSAVDEMQSSNSPNKDYKVIDIIPKKELEIHGVVAEFMILANSSVATRIFQAFPHSALLRHHVAPSASSFDLLLRCAKACGFQMDTKSNATLAHSLSTCSDPNNVSINKQFRMMASRAMSEAAYVSTGAVSHDQLAHYGLAIDLYTHFTSPIRRYADIIVHRQLMAAISDSNGSLLSSLPDNLQLSSLAGHINTRNRESKYAQRESTELFQTVFFKERFMRNEDVIVEGVVIGLFERGLIVYVQGYGVKVTVLLCDNNNVASVAASALYSTGDEDEVVTGGSLCIKDDKLVLTAAGSECLTFRLFCQVTLKSFIKESRYHRNSMRFSLVRLGAKSERQHSGHTVSKQQRMMEQHSTTITNSYDIDMMKAISESEVMAYKQSYSLYDLLEDFRDLSMNSD